MAVLERVVERRAARQRLVVVVVVVVVVAAVVAMLVCLVIFITRCPYSTAHRPPPAAKRPTTHTHLVIGVGVLPQEVLRHPLVALLHRAHEERAPVHVGRLDRHVEVVQQLLQLGEIAVDDGQERELDVLLLLGSGLEVRDGGIVYVGGQRGGLWGLTFSFALGWGSGNK